MCGGVGVIVKRVAAEDMAEDGVWCGAYESTSLAALWNPGDVTWLQTPNLRSK